MRKILEINFEKVAQNFGENYDEIGREICLFYTDIYERKHVRSGPQISCLTVVKHSFISSLHLAAVLRSDKALTNNFTFLVVCEK